MKKILNVVGARPNFMKIAPIIEAIDKYNQRGERPYFRQLLVHTGQHYDDNMSRSFFEDLEIPKPDIYLEVSSGSHAEQTGKIILELEKVLLKKKPDLVLVVGDVNSTLACSIVATKLCIPVAHVEAGLRSFDRTMPEEINRKVTDSLSDFLFTTCEDANENLKREGIPKEKIFFVGNVMIDTLLRHYEKAKKSQILRKLGLMRNVSDNSYEQSLEYAILTLHRPSNVDNRDNLQRIIEALRTVSNKIPIIFPIHPRTKKQIEIFGFYEYFIFHNVNCVTPTNRKNYINCIEPLGYLDFLYLVANAKFVLTDSGGIQEETTILGVPCLTLRENTERPVTMIEGTNTLVGTDRDRIITESLKILNGENKTAIIPKLWDGKAAQRIVKILSEEL